MELRSTRTAACHALAALPQRCRAPAALRWRVLAVRRRLLRWIDDVPVHALLLTYKGWLRELDETGDPVDGYDPAGAACAHLLALLSSGPVGLTEMPLHLVAFSKGAVALNQILAEISAADDPGSAPQRLLHVRAHALPALVRW